MKVKDKDKVMETPTNIYILTLLFLVVGFLEMLFWSLQTKSLVKDRILNTSIFTGVSVLIWYYVVDNIAKNMGKWSLMVAYVIGCVLGNVVTIKLDSYIDKLAKKRLWKKKRKKQHRIIKKR